MKKRFEIVEDVYDCGKRLWSVYEHVDATGRERLAEFETRDEAVRVMNRLSHPTFNCDRFVDYESAVDAFCDEYVLADGSHPDCAYDHPCELARWLFEHVPENADYEYVAVELFGHRVYDENGEIVPCKGCGSDCDASELDKSGLCNECHDRESGDEQF